MTTSPSSDLKVDAAAHRYWLGDRELVPVTRVLEIEGFIDTTWFTEESRTRGTYVHQACDLDDAGSLDDESLDPGLVPYVDAYRLFKQQMSVGQFPYVELPLAHAPLGVAGRIDRLSEGQLLDIKSGADEPSHAFQTALYALLAEYNGLVPSARRLTRGCVHLLKNGSFQMVWHTDANDLRLAKAAAEVAVYKVAHGFASMKRAA
jgi:hypothetical protein